MLESNTAIILKSVILDFPLFPLGEQSLSCPEEGVRANPFSLTEMLSCSRRVGRAYGFLWADLKASPCHQLLAVVASFRHTIRRSLHVRMAQKS